MIVEESNYSTRINILYKNKQLTQEHNLLYKNQLYYKFVFLVII